jgi:hypothetical protein
MISAARASDRTSPPCGMTPNTQGCSARHITEWPASGRHWCPRRHRQTTLMDALCKALRDLRRRQPKDDIPRLPKNARRSPLRVRQYPRLSGRGRVCRVHQAAGQAGRFCIIVKALITVECVVLFPRYDPCRRVAEIFQQQPDDRRAGQRPFALRYQGMLPSHRVLPRQNVPVAS